MNEPLSTELLIEESKIVQSQVVGDLMQQIAIQRTINRQQEQIIHSLRSRIEELLKKD